jgi:hypothetical protein
MKRYAPLRLHKLHTETLEALRIMVDAEIALRKKRKGKG